MCVFPSKVRTLVKTTNSSEFSAGWHDNHPFNVLPASRPRVYHHRERGLEPLLRIGQVVLELSYSYCNPNVTTSSSVHTKPSVVRHVCCLVSDPQTPEAVGLKVRYVRLDANTAVSIPFEKNKTRR